MRVPLDSLPARIDPEAAFRAAYGEQVTELLGALTRLRRVLIEVETELMPPLYQELVRQLAGASAPALRPVYVAGRPRRVELGPLELLQSSGPTRDRRRELDEHLRLGDPGLLAVVPHFELLALGDDRGARELLAGLIDFPQTRVLALQAPDVVLPGTVSDAFGRRGSFGGELNPACLPHLITRREARKFFTEELDPEEFLAQAGPLNALQLRRELPKLVERLDYDPRHPDVRDQLYRELRALSRPVFERRRDLSPVKRGQQQWVLRGAGSAGPGEA